MSPSTCSPPTQASPRVVIAHDYATQTGGAERVALGLLAAFPGSRLVTSAYSPRRTFPQFREHDIETLWINRVPAFRRDPRLAFPVLARAWENHVIEDADVVICSSSGWSHGVTTDATKIVYCHNPARWIYQPDEYLLGAGPAARAAHRALSRGLEKWDQRRAESVTRYVANSSSVAGRIVSSYGLDSTILPPPVMLDPFGPQEAMPGVAPGFLLSVSRARGYKNVEVVCEAVEGLPGERLLVLGDLPARKGGGTWDSRLQGLGRVSDAQLRWLYAHCSAVVSASYEDFGLTPLEGNLFGAPAIVLRAGGFLDTLVEGMTGCFIEEPTAAAVQEAILSVPAVDPSLLRTYANGFRLEGFIAKMRALVAETVTPTVSAPVSLEDRRLGRLARNGELQLTETA
ncbi:MAG: glycosyltransferase family 4 protein [Frankiales bacterium]|nr:glycosyltransferase family 4 protein [Frankiales bacterium]